MAPKHLALYILLALWLLPLAAASPQTPAPRPEVAALLEQGEKASQVYQYAQALDRYTQALTKARELQDRPGEASALFGLALTQKSLGRPDQARELLQQALTLQKAFMDRPGEARTLNSLGNVSADLSEWQKALEYY